MGMTLEQNQGGPGREQFRKYAKFVVAVTGLVMFLRSLNSFVFNAWASGVQLSPEGEYGAYAAQADYHAGMALGSILLSWGLLRWLSRKWMPNSILLLTAGTITSAGPTYQHWQIVDSCLDNGGAWNQKRAQCQFAHGIAQYYIKTPAVYLSPPPPKTGRTSDSLQPRK